MASSLTPTEQAEEAEIDRQGRKFGLSIMPTLVALALLLNDVRKGRKRLAVVKEVQAFTAPDVVREVWTVRALDVVDGRLAPPAP